MADYIPNCENNVRFVCPYSPNCENNVKFPETTCETNVLLGESDGYADCVSVAELTTEHYNVLGINNGYTDCVSEAELRTYPTIHLGINYFSPSLLRNDFVKCEYVFYSSSKLLVDSSSKYNQLDKPKSE